MQCQSCTMEEPCVNSTKPNTLNYLHEPMINRMKNFSLFTSSTTSNVSFTKTTYKKLVHIYTIFIYLYIFSLLSSAIFPCFILLSLSTIIRFCCCFAVCCMFVVEFFNFSQFVCAVESNAEISQFCVCFFYFILIYFFFSSSQKT